MIDFCILGSGIAGSTIANLLSTKYKVEIFEKAKGYGGRSSNRRYKNNLSFDHGLQYINPKSKEFNLFIKNLKRKGVLKIWDGNHIDFTHKKMSTKYIGSKANNDISKYLVKNIKTNLNVKITRINFKKTYWEIWFSNEFVLCKNLILTLPHPQTTQLGKCYFNDQFNNLKVKMEPNITIMAAFKKTSNLNISSMKFDNEKISWAASENSKKRFKSKLNLWTIQASAKYSKKIINKYKNKKKLYCNDLLKTFCKLTGFEYKNIIFKNIHGWKFSYNYKKTKYSSYWDKKYRLGICADWLLGPKAENAWLSAKDLYKRIKKTPLIS